MKLNLTETQAAAVYAILCNVRLGDANKYESSIGSLLDEMEYDLGDIRTPEVKFKKDYDGNRMIVLKE